MGRPTPAPSAQRSRSRHGFPLATRRRYSRRRARCPFGAAAGGEVPEGRVRAVTRACLPSSCADMGVRPDTGQAGGLHPSGTLSAPGQLAVPPQVPPLPPNLRCATGRPLIFEERQTQGRCSAPAKVAPARGDGRGTDGAGDGKAAGAEGSGRRDLLARAARLLWLVVGHAVGGNGTPREFVCMAVILQRCSYLRTAPSARADSAAATGVRGPSAHAQDDMAVTHLPASRHSCKSLQLSLRGRVRGREGQARGRGGRRKFAPGARGPPACPRRLQLRVGPSCQVIEAPPTGGRLATSAALAPSPSSPSCQHASSQACSLPPPGPPQFLHHTLLQVSRARARAPKGPEP